MSKTQQMPRYGVVPDSASGHGCCFVASVVDTQDPEALALNAAPEAPPESVGVKIVCECFTEGAAQTIAAALNAIHDAQQRLLASMPPEARAFLDELKAFVTKPPKEGDNNVH